MSNEEQTRDKIEESILLLLKKVNLQNLFKKQLQKKKLNQWLRQSPKQKQNRKSK